MSFYERTFCKKFDYKKSIEMNFRVITKNNAAVPEMGFPAKKIPETFSIQKMVFRNL